MDFTRVQLKELAGLQSWQRGVDYFNDGAVVSLIEDHDVVVAKVQGTHTYKVKLWMEEGELDGECTCPYGQEGEFCKHCVAAGLTYLEGSEKSGQTDRGRTKLSKKEVPSMDDLRRFLRKQNVNDLVEILMKQAMDDEKLLSRLMMKLSRNDKKKVNLSAFRQAIDQATAIDPMDYDGPLDAASSLDDLVENLREMLDEGHAGDVLTLTEYALERFARASEYMEDSSGLIGDMFHELLELHHDACVVAKPDPEQLARQLFDWEIKKYSSYVYQSYQSYADVLGKKGLAVFFQLVEAQWNRLPILKIGQREQSYDGRRYRLKSIMEDLTRNCGDLDALIAVQSKDLSSPHNYLAIAELCRENKKYDQAIQWAQEGLKAFSTRPDRQLRKFLADEYHRQKRHGEAIDLIWANFEDFPALHTYQDLKEHAERINEWSKWRERSLTFIRKKIVQDTKNARRNSWSTKINHSLLVQIFLWEKDIETAWAEAQTGGCSEDLWLKLAQLRSREHPADVIPIYQRHVERLVHGGGNDNYKDAITWIKKIEPLMKAGNRETEFTSYLQTLRLTHGRKRNFLALLNRV